MADQVSTLEPGLLVNDWFTWWGVFVAVLVVLLWGFLVAVLPRERIIPEPEYTDSRVTARCDRNGHFCVWDGEPPYPPRSQRAWRCTECGHTVRPVETVFDQESGVA